MANQILNQSSYADDTASENDSDLNTSNVSVDNILNKSTTGQKNVLW